jgi:glycine/D-amino acid oxidase-like deaminating enzyme
VRPGVWTVGGYSGTGNVVGAICGRAAAQVIVTGRTPDAWFLAR